MLGTLIIAHDFNRGSVGADRQMRLNILFLPGIEGLQYINDLKTRLRNLQFSEQAGMLVLPTQIQSWRMRIWCKGEAFHSSIIYTNIIPKCFAPTPKMDYVRRTADRNYGIFGVLLDTWLRRNDAVGFYWRWKEQQFNVFNV